jgi:hypothetical protein
MKNVILFGVLFVLCACEKSVDNNESTTNIPSATKATPTVTIDDVIKGYLDVKNCNERLSYVDEPDTLKDIFEKSYSETDCKMEYVSINTGNCKNVNPCYVQVKVKGKNSFNADIFQTFEYCIVNNDGLSIPKIDWKCSKGYNQFSLKSFMMLHDEDNNYIFRVKAKLEKVFDKFIILEIFEKEENEGINVLLEKKDLNSKSIISLLSDNDKHAITVALEFVPELKIPKIKVVIANRFLTESELKKVNILSQKQTQTQTN